MAKKDAPQNGRERLEDALAMLIQNQASFLGRLSETERVTSERFARIEADMAAITRRLVESYREMVKEKRG